MLGDAVTILANPHYPSPPRHRRRHRTSKNPSSYLLAFLATISKLSTGDALVVNCKTEPLEFLCPILFRRSEADPTKQYSSTRSTSLSSRPSHINTLDSRDVPDHYVKGTDGLWYQLPYATTLPCPSPTPPSLPVDIDDTDDVANVASGSVNSSSPSSGSTSMSIKLPAGWQHSEPSDVYRVPLIVVSAVILACIIVVLIVGMVTWRRRSNRRAKELSLIDVENNLSCSKKRRKKRKKKVVEKDTSSDSEDNLEAEERDGQDRRPHIQSNIRAKATARWKAHARWIHRRSRGKRAITVNTSSIPQPVEEDTHTSRTNPPCKTNQEPTQIENSSDTIDPSPNGEVLSDVRVIEQILLADPNHRIPSDWDTSDEEILESNNNIGDTFHGRNTTINEILSSSFSPLPEPSHIHDIPPESNSNVQSEAGDESDLEEELLNGLPPAYQRARSVTSLRSRHPSLNEHIHSQNFNDDKGQASLSSRERNSSGSLPDHVNDFVDHIDDENSRCSEPTLEQVAHVATDDKQVLARIADMASAPPASSSDFTSRYTHSHNEGEIQPPYPITSDPQSSEQVVTIVPQQGFSMQATVPEWPIVEDNDFEESPILLAPSFTPSGCQCDDGRLYSNALYLPPPPEPNIVHLELELENGIHYSSFPHAPNYLPQHLDFDTDLNSDAVVPSEPPLDNVHALEDTRSEDQGRIFNQPSAPSLSELASEVDIDIDLQLSEE